MCGEGCCFAVFWAEVTLGTSGSWAAHIITYTARIEGCHPHITHTTLTASHPHTTQHNHITLTIHSQQVTLTLYNTTQLHHPHTTQHNHITLTLHNTITSPSHDTHSTVTVTLTRHSQSHTVGTNTECKYVQPQTSATVLRYLSVSLGLVTATCAHIPKTFCNKIFKS